MYGRTVGNEHTDFGFPNLRIFRYRVLTNHRPTSAHSWQSERVCDKRRQTLSFSPGRHIATLFTSRADSIFPDEMICHFQRRSGLPNGCIPNTMLIVMELYRIQKAA